jgi:hypothetical protein
MCPSSRAPGDFSNTPRERLHRIGCEHPEVWLGGLRNAYPGPGEPSPPLARIFWHRLNPCTIAPRSGVIMWKSGVDLSLSSDEDANERTGRQVRGLLPAFPCFGLLALLPPKPVALAVCIALGPLQHYLAARMGLLPP